MKKIFLTGSSGLLGLSLYNLLKNKYRITRITNNIKYKKSSKFQYIFKIKILTNFFSFILVMPKYEGT